MSRVASLLFAMLALPAVGAHAQPRGRDVCQLVDMNEVKGILGADSVEDFEAGKEPDPAGGILSECVIAAEGSVLTVTFTDLRSMRGVSTVIAPPSLARRMRANRIVRTDDHPTRRAERIIRAVADTGAISYTSIDGFRVVTASVRGPAAAKLGAREEALREMAELVSTRR